VDETILTIHILSAAVWIGSSSFFAFAGPRFAKVGGPPALAWIGIVIDAIRKFLVPAALLTGISGMVLVATQDEWEWSDGFVSIGLAVFVVVLGIGTGFNLPNLKKAQKYAADGDFQAVGATARKVARAGGLMILLLVFAEAAMVFRLGA
jgi:hypothetical protein